MSRLSLLLLCVILAHTASHISAQEFFFRDDKAKAFDALLKPNSPKLWPDEFAAQHGGTPLPAGGTWCPPEQNWVAYRYLGLRYWFQVPLSRSAESMVDDLKARVNTDRELRADFEKGVIRIYKYSFAKGQCVPMAELMTDPSGNNGKQEAAALEKEINGLGDKLGKAKKSSDKAGKSDAPGDLDKAWGDMRDAEVGLMAGSIIVDEEGQEIFNELRRKYGMPPPGTHLPDGILPPGEIWKVFAPDMKNGPFEEDGELNTQTPVGPDGKPIAQQGEDKDDSSSKGMKGPFKVKTPFAKWFVVVVKLVARYFGLEQLGNRILFVAYLVAPEIFDACASFLAKCQQALTPNGLGDFLDKVADVYLAIESFIPYLKQAYELLHDGNLQSLMDHVDWEKFNLGKTLDALEKVKVLPKDKLDKIREFAPIDIINGNAFSDPNALRQNIQNYAIDKAFEQADKGLGKIGLSVSGLKGCINASDKSDCALSWAKDQSARAATAHIPGLRNHYEAIRLTMENKPKEALESAVLNELTNRTGLPMGKIQKLYETLERGDLKEFVLSGAELGLFKTARCEEISASAIQAIRNGQATDEMIKEAAICGAEIMGSKRATKYIDPAWDLGKGMADDIRQHGSIGAWAEREMTNWKSKIKSELKSRGFDDKQISDWLLGAGATVLQDQLRKQLAVLGFNAPGAVDAIIAGDLEQAIDLQMQYQKGSPVPLKEKAQQMRQLLQLREQYLDNLYNDIQQRMQDPNYLEAEILKRVTKKTR
jgi:hypothetical protein